MTLTRTLLAQARDVLSLLCPKPFFEPRPDRCGGCGAVPGWHLVDCEWGDES